MFVFVRFLFVFPTTFPPSFFSSLSHFLLPLQNIPILLSSSSTKDIAEALMVSLTKTHTLSVWASNLSLFLSYEIWLSFLLLHQGHTGPVYALRYTKNGAYLLSGGDDRAVQVSMETHSSFLLFFHFLFCDYLCISRLLFSFVLCILNICSFSCGIPRLVFRSANIWGIITR